MKKYIVLLLTCFFLQYTARAYQRVQVAQLLEEQSYTALLQFVQSTPESERDNYLLNAAGYAAYQSNLLTQSVQYYRESYTKDSTNIQANLYLGLLYKQQKMYGEALNYFNRLSVLKPGQARYLKYAADCYLGLKNEDSALVYLSRASEMAPSDLVISQSLAEMLYAKKDYQKLDALVEYALTIDSNNIPLLSMGIRSLYAQKHYKKVIPIAERLSRSNSASSIHAPLMFGVFAALQIKDYRQCLKFTDALMREGSESEQVYYYAAKAYSGLKQYERSVACLQKCLDLAISENTETYYIEMGENLEQMQQYHKAQKQYDTARYLFGSNMTLYRKALAYDAMKDKQKAKKAYLDFLKAAKNEDTALLNFAKKRSADL